MSLFKKILGKAKGDKAKADKLVDKKPKPEAEETGTVLRQPDKATPITKGKERAERTALEIAEKKEWEVKTLPVWQTGDVILDTYEVEDVIFGGMGHVYIANHKKWNVKLAIKSPNEMMLSDKSNFVRILREANSWTELGLHPSIAYCYYIRNIEDVPHIFVEYVDGGNLRQWIEEGKCIDYRVNLDLAIQFCHGMEYAHSKGMIHRDIKPENILMTKDGVLKITDFGLVRGGDSLQAEDPSVQCASQAKGSSLTIIGAEMGTWGYMSPEQKENPHEVDERTDIFAFGVCLYEMFCGNRPYEITFGPKQEPPDPVFLSGDESFPVEIGAVLTKTVQWDPIERYKNFSEIRQELLCIYRELFGEQSPYAELELLDLETDGLNNQGVSYFDLGRKEDAVSCWEKALEINQLHSEATYNLSLIQWRDGKIDDLEVLVRLDNCGKNPAVDRERLAELKSFIHAERMDLEGAKQVLKEFPGRYETLFAGKDIEEIGCLRTLEGHTSFVQSVAISSDGRYAVSGSGDTSLRVWEIESGQCLYTLQGHTGWWVRSVTLSSDGRYAVSGSDDKTLRVWELANGRCIRILEGHTSSVYSVALSPDGRYAVSGSDDKTLRVWELASGQCVRTLKGHTSLVYSVALSPDCQYAVSGSKDKTLRVWELASGQCVRTMEGHMSSVYSVALSSDGRYVVSGSGDTSLRMWEFASGRCVQILEGHIVMVTSVAISPDSRYAVSGSRDKTLRVWELSAGQCVRTLEGHTDIVDSVVISSDGRHAVSGSRDKTLRVWNITFDKPHLADLMVCLPKGYKEVKQQEDTFDQAVNQAEALFKEKKYSDSFSILYETWKDTGFSKKDSAVRLYSSLIRKGRIQGLTFSFQKQLLTGHTAAVSSVALSPDGRYAVSGSWDKTLRVWELASGQCVRTLKGHTSLVFSVALSPDCQYAVSGSKDKTLRVWELASGQCVRTMEGHSSFVFSVALSPDGRYAVSASLDASLRVWELASGRCVQILEGHTEKVNSVALSPDCQYAVSGSKDKTLRVWELASGQCVCTLEGHSSFVFSVALSPDGRYAVSASSDRTLRVWELADGQCVRTLKGHSDSARLPVASLAATLTAVVYSVALSPDGRYAVSASFDKTLRVWELASGQCVRTLKGHTTFVQSVAVSPDGRYAVSAGIEDKTLRVWELIWDLEFPKPVDWDEGVRPYLEIFLTLRNGNWTEEDFQELINELAEKRGYGWVRPEGIKKELERMKKDIRN